MIRNSDLPHGCRVEYSVTPDGVVTSAYFHGLLVDNYASEIQAELALLVLAFQAAEQTPIFTEPPFHTDTPIFQDCF